jgi:hypothetical protein
MNAIMTSSREIADKDWCGIIMKVDSGEQEQTFDVAASLHHHSDGSSSLP